MTSSIKRRSRKFIAVQLTVSVRRSRMFLSSSSIPVVMLAQLPTINTVAETFTRARITTNTAMRRCARTP